MSKRVLAIGRQEQRKCYTCGRWSRCTVTRTGDGWERVVCAWGHLNEWRVVGHPN